MSCNDPCGDQIQINLETGSQGPIGPPGPPATVVNHEFNLLAGDTIISGTNNSGNEFSYNPESVQVFINGVLLSGTDYTATDGVSVILNEAAANNNDLAQITTQIPPEDYDPTNDNDRLQGQIDDNKQSIEDLDGRVTQNESDIADLQADAGAQTVTTADVMTVGALPFADPAEDPKTQQEANWILHDWIKAGEQEIADARNEFQGLDQDVTNLTQSVTDLATDVDDIAISVATNTVNISKNATDIARLDSDIGDIIVPDLSPIDARVTDLETVTGEHEGRLDGLRTDVDALGAPVNLDPLNAAIADNAAGVAKNASDIAGIRVVDAQQTGQINDLQIAVGNLEAIDHDTSSFAEINKDNEFTTSQTIRDGVKLTGSNAFVEADTGTPISFRNNNFSNPVINVMRSNGDVAISLEASGHIRGVVTDGTDPTSAVSVEYLEANGVGGGDHDHSTYATKLELKEEERQRELADVALGKRIDDAIDEEKYDDTQIKNALAQEEAARKSSDNILDNKITNEANYRQQEDEKLQDQIDLLSGGSIDLSGYALTTYVDSQDADLQSQIDALSASGGYNDAWIQPAIDLGDSTTLADAKDYTDQEIAAIPPIDLSDYATKEEVVDGDAKSLDDAKKYTDTKFDAVTHPPGTIVKDTEPADSPNGTNWFDTVRLELFVRASDAWLPSSPLGARVTQGEIVQAQLLERVTTGEQNQNKITADVRGNSNDISSMNIRVQQNSGKIANNEQAIAEIQALPDPVAPDVDKDYVDTELAKKIGNTGEQVLPTDSWKIRARKTSNDGNYSYLSIENDKLHLYHVADPTNDAHGLSRGYCDGRYSRKQVPVVMKTNGSMACVTQNIPPSKSFCGLYNTSPGSSTNGNPYFGNFNSDIRVNIDGLKNPEGEQFAVGESYNLSGFVSIFGAEDGKLYFKHAITNVARSSSHDYVQLHFASRVPAWGTGEYYSQSKFVLVVEGLMDKPVNTVDIPAEDIE